MILEFEVKPIFDIISADKPASAREALTLEVLKHLKEADGGMTYSGSEIAPEIQKLKTFTCRDIPLPTPLGYITLEVHRYEKYWNATANLIGNPELVDKEFRKQLPAELENILGERWVSASKSDAWGYVVSEDMKPLVSIIGHDNYPRFCISIGTGGAPVLKLEGLGKFRADMFYLVDATNALANAHMNVGVKKGIILENPDLKVFVNVGGI